MIDSGKPRALALRMDVARSEDNFRFFAGFARNLATHGVLPRSTACLYVCT